MTKTECRCAVLISLIGMSTSTLMIARILSSPITVEAHKIENDYHLRIRGSETGAFEPGFAERNASSRLLALKPPICSPAFVQPSRPNSDSRRQRIRVADTDRPSEFAR